jgi:hypothetical protein
VELSGRRYQVKDWRFDAAWSGTEEKAMKTQRLVMALAAVNVVLMILVLTFHAGAGQAQTAPGVLRGRSLELVDDQGRIRASIKVGRRAALAASPIPRRWSCGSSIPTDVLS